MEKIKAVWGELRENKRKMQVFCIAAGLFALLIAGLCISICMHANIHHEYAFATEYIQDQVYGKMASMAETYSRIDDPSVDVQNKLIPELKAQYTALVSLNNALADGFDAEHAVLSSEQIEAFDYAFSEYANAYRTGSPTGLARADMDVCMADVQKMLDIYYASENPVEPPVEITYGETSKPEN